MKKIYNVPSVKVTPLQVNRNLLYSVSDKVLSGDKAGWAKEDNDWWDDED